MNKSEKFWDRAANTYDQEEKKDEQTTLKIIEKTRKYLKSSGVVLDHGCGTGTIDIAIAGDVKEIKAIDISSNMVDLARRKITKMKIHNIDYKQATIFDEGLRGKFFDVVTTFTLLHLLEDNQREINRIHELLKPKGLFISSTPCMGEKRITYVVLSFFSKFGLVPEIVPFRYPELKETIIKSDFEIIETECLHLSSRQYFIVARKNKKYYKN